MVLPSLGSTSTLLGRFSERAASRAWAASLVVGALSSVPLGCAGPSGASARPAPESARPAAPRTIRRPGEGLSGVAGQRELETAMAAARKEDLETAIAQAEAAIARNPGLEAAYLLLGSCASMREDAALERAAYVRGIEALPSSVPLRRALGFLELTQGDYGAAAKTYQVARELDGKETPELLADLAWALALGKRLEEARPLAETAAKEASCFHCQMVLGEVRLGAKDFGGARAAYARASALDPESVEARAAEARAAFLAGALDEARALYEALVAADPDDARLRAQAAQVAMKQKRPKEAVAHLLKVLETNPDDRALLEYLAEAQTQAGDTRGAQATRRRKEALGAK
jgi:cytochrome c-type biogenesis protein CcmH/NrfG